MSLLKYICALCCLASAQVFALPVPKPIEGSAFISSKEFSTGSGDYLFTFKFPPGWGIGEMSSSPDGSGHFFLFPLSKGVGCSIEVSSFETEELAKNQMESFRGTFSSAKSLDDGFEVELPKAWYACRRSEEQLIQVWYSVPKKKKEDAALWQSLKTCVTVENTGKFSFTADGEFAPITEVSRKGWYCNHPSNKIHVMFESFPLVTCEPSNDATLNYALKFSDFKSSGFFYVKWDQTDLDKNAPYLAHLNEMLKDIKKIDPTHKVTESATFDLEQGYAVSQGNPYTLISISGDGFLFGFAVKAKNKFIGFDINDLIKQIHWIIED